MLSKIRTFLNRTPLINRICFFSFCFSASLTLIYLVGQGVGEYHDEREMIKRCLVEQSQTELSDLAGLMWGKNDAGVKQALYKWQRLCEMPEAEPAETLIRLEHKDGRKIEIGEQFITGPSIELSLPVHYRNDNNQEFWLGELFLQKSLMPLYKDLSRDAIWEILTHVLIIGAGAVLGMLLGYSLFVKRISSLLRGLQDRDVRLTLRHALEKEDTELSRLWRRLLNLFHELDMQSEEASLTLGQAQQDQLRIKKQSDAKSQFLAKMSHELRTPMNGLLGFSALLQETKLDNEQREYAQTIQVSLESLLHVVNDVLDLSRIESGELHIASMPFNLRGVISGVISLVQKRAESKGLSLDSRVSPDIPPMMRGDPVRIRQILLNLISNAIEHTEKGYVLINLETVSHPSGNQAVRISIEDTGNDPELRHNNPNDDLGISAFSSELRARRSLGLDVCYQLAELMGTSIHHETLKSGGNIFWVDLLMPTVHQELVSDPIDFGLVQHLNVLVIDSYELSRKITMELLQEWGVEFDAVSSLDEAIKRLKHNDIQQGGFNMVLCDDLLQDVAGMEACARIRQLTPKEMRVVVLSSNPQLGDAEGFFLSGANGFLSKHQRDPFLKPILCQVFAERDISTPASKRLVTRYTISDDESFKEREGDAIDKVKRGSVLVVEDNIVNQQLAAKLLEKKGFSVDLAANGFEAIELFKSNRYLMIFMDCLMPDMNGYETTQIIRELEKSNEALGRTPIIALTAHAIEGEAERCFNVGMDEFVTKPFKLSKLEMVLERYIN